MSQIFNAINEFLNSNEKEVLVVELTHTYNGKGQLSDLVSLISNTLGHHLTPCCRYVPPLHCSCGGAIGRYPGDHQPLPCSTAGVVAAQTLPCALAACFIAPSASTCSSNVLSSRSAADGKEAAGCDLVLRRLL